MKKKPIKKLKLSELKPAGESAFEELIARSKAGEFKSKAKLNAEIDLLLRNKKYSNILDKNIDVDRSLKLKLRQNVAEHIDALLKKSKGKWDPGKAPGGMWSWLALVFFDQITNKKSKPGNIDRYKYSDTKRRKYRHQILGPYLLYKEAGLYSRVFLCQEAFEHPDIAEQIQSRPEIMLSKGVQELLHYLYWDRATKKLKTGFSDREDDDTPSLGTMRSFEYFCSRLACSYDLQSMSAGEIKAKWPEEFDDYLAAKTPKQLERAKKTTAKKKAAKKSSPKVPPKKKRRLSKKTR